MEVVVRGLHPDEVLGAKVEIGDCAGVGVGLGLVLTEAFFGGENSV